jgi:hypothetical protein
MTHATATSANAAPQPVETIIVRPRSGVWRVDVDGKFYGDYSRGEWAIEGAFEKAHHAAARGGAAVVKAAGDGKHDSILYDSRYASSPPRPAVWSFSSFLETILKRFWSAEEKSSAVSAARNAFAGSRLLGANP